MANLELVVAAELVGGFVVAPHGLVVVLDGAQRLRRDVEVIRCSSAVVGV